MLLGRTSRLPVASPLGISVYSVDHLAPDLQPWKQKPICWQEPRPSRGWLLIAIRAGMDFLVAELARAGLHHLVIVVAGQARNAVGARDAHLVLGLGVPRLHLGERDRPVEQVGAGDIAVGAA